MSFALLREERLELYKKREAVIRGFIAQTEDAFVRLCLEETMARLLPTVKTSWEDPGLHAARSKKKNDLTRAQAVAGRTLWKTADDELLMSSKTDEELAMELGRSLKAVGLRRMRIRARTP